jgi:hypothetical protein
METLKQELVKDKYLAFALVILLLVAFIRTSNGALEQLLVTTVGVMAGLLRSGSTQNIASGEGSSVQAEPKL